MTDGDLIPCQLCTVPMSLGDYTTIDINMPTKAAICWDCVDCVLRACAIDDPSRRSILNNMAQ